MINIKSAAILAALALPALLGACANKTDAANSAGSGGTSGLTTNSAAPGSQEDLAQNVGDKVLFATDSSTLSGDGRATLDRQAGWLGRYPQVQDPLQQPGVGLVAGPLRDRRPRGPHEAARTGLGVLTGTTVVRSEPRSTTII